MTAEMEFTGRNVKKALQQAADRLGIPAEEIDFQIISHGSSGIFGLAGVKKARILVKSQTVADASSGDAVEDITGEEEKRFDETAETGSDNLEEALSVGESVLRRMVEAISPEATIDVERDDKRIMFRIQGGQSGILIGKRGQTLDAMQLLVEKAVRRSDGHDFRLQVDVEGYLAKKEAALVQTAERLAKKVATKGKPGSIGYLNAQDRRVVHIALKNHQGVRTKSVGEGFIRKLMIYPTRPQKPKS